jgi:hypothetical protein
MDFINMAERALAGITSVGSGTVDTLVQLRNLRTSFDRLETRHTEKGIQLLVRIDQQINMLDPPKPKMFKPRFPIFGKKRG